MGEVIKVLLVILIRLLIADVGVAPLVVTIVKMAGDAGLGISQVGKNGPVAGFELLGFQAGPQASGLGRTFLGIVVAFALPGTTSSAVLELSLGVGQVGKNGPVADFELLGFQAGP